METITYEKFKDQIKHRGFDVVENEILVKVVNGKWGMATISKIERYALNTDVVAFTALKYGAIQKDIYDLCSMLAETPLSER